MPVFAILWPWIGLGAAGSLLLVLICTDGLQANRAISRWRDLPWLVWLGLAACMLHDFEANGIDGRGMPYAFRGDLCRILGYRDAIACPVPLSFITAANVAAVWGAGGLSALLAKRWPSVGLSFFALVLVKALVPMGASVLEGRYMPGVMTACLLLLPLSLWTLSMAVTRSGLGRSSLAYILAGAIAAPMILVGALQAYLHDYIGLWPLGLMAVLAGFAPAGLMSAGTRRRIAPPPPPQPRRKPKLRAVEKGDF